MFEGCFPAMITPFKKDGAIDEEGIRQLVNYFIDQNVSGIVACGTTGESATMSHEEDLRVASIVVDEVNGRVPVIAGTGSNSTASAVKYTQDAENLGVDGALVVGPYYNKPNQKGLAAHYSEVAGNTKLNIIIYNVPGRTGRNIEPETVIGLSELFDNIVAVKEASGNLGQAMKIIDGASKKFNVLSGEDALTYAMMALGGKGTISATANVIPKQYSEMVQLMLEKDYEKARQLHYEYVLPASELCFMDTNPIPAKSALRMMGLPSGTFRLPLCDLPEEKEEKLRAGLKKLGLLK